MVRRSIFSRKTVTSLSRPKSKPGLYLPDGTDFLFLVHEHPSMAEHRSDAVCTSSERSWSPVTPSSSTEPTPPPLPNSLTSTLIQPSKKKKQKTKVFRVFSSVFRSFPIINPSCKFPTINMGIPDVHHRNMNAIKVTGTLFGYRKGRVSLSMQETPRSLPTLVVELAIHTNALQKEMSAGMVRIALECEKRPEKEKTRLLDEPMWSMFYNGKKAGYGMKREPTGEDLSLMELLKAVSMGVGVLPGGSESSDVDGGDGELAYVRAPFEHVVGSKDSETLYMLSPELNGGPELTIFFVRI